MTHWCPEMLFSPHLLSPAAESEARSRREFAGDETNGDRRPEAGQRPVSGRTPGRGHQVMWHVMMWPWMKEAALRGDRSLLNGSLKWQCRLYLEISKSGAWFLLWYCQDFWSHSNLIYDGDMFPKKRFSICMRKK